MLRAKPDFAAKLWHLPNGDVVSHEMYEALLDMCKPNTSYNVTGTQIEESFATLLKPGLKKTIEAFYGF